NSTISGNTAGNNGGGIYNGYFQPPSLVGNTTLNSTTITNNDANNNGGGVFNASDATVNTFNTIIADNNATNPDVSGSFNDQGNNLIGNSNGSTGFTTSDLVGTSANPIDPLLAPLGDYGGTTQTHTLLPGSPAINAGSNNNAPATDQRGVTRGTVDIGAVEVSTDLAVNKTVDKPVTFPGDQITYTITITNNGTDAVGGISLTDILPDGITFTSAAASQGNYDVATGIWTVGDLGSNLNPLNGTTATLDITATVNLTSQNVTINSIGDLSYIGEETNPDNNQSSIAIATFPNNLLIPPQEKDFNLEEQIKQLNISLNKKQPSPLTIDLPETEQLIQQLEANITKAFQEYLDLPNYLLTDLQQARSILQRIEKATNIKPAIIYARFLPATTDASVEGQKLPPNQQLSSENNYQLELILVTASGEVIRRPLPNTTKAEVIRQAKHFRRTITNPFREAAYIKPGQQFYQWLVAPLEADLQEREIDNLVFILDEGLRGVPLAAMLDGNQFVIEKYSVGLMPSLSLTDTNYVDVKKLKVLAMGADTFTEQNPLPAVPKELSLITKQLWSGKSYLNENFTLKNLKQARNQDPFGIIHLATHGEFKPGEPSNSYIQLWEQKLSLDSLRTLDWNNPSVELLVLSACRTALGSREAELGFAGLAVQAGVKSALGSLWTVSDDGTLGLMSSFYQQLKTAPIKAEALRQAQLTMLRGEVYLEDGQLVSGDRRIALPDALADLGDQDLTHPYYWSGFTMIGNPW
ncbi:MAG: CHAT domain-containing protein, partial [Spirulinaceae cyanobacterium]